MLCLQQDQGHVPKRTRVQTARDHTGILPIGRRCQLKQRCRSQIGQATTINQGHMQLPEAYDAAATSVPLLPIDTNRGKLEEWIRDYYKGSTFNVCEHQPLPLMEGPPVCIMVDPKASPVTIHTPISVPLHWQKQVKADLDRDIALGVIEPVPVSEPMTWCSRMVITRKKSGGPRRCVDFSFFRLFPSGVATADFLSPVSPINCILLRHFNLSHVLFHHIHKPPFWPSPFPTSPLTSSAAEKHTTR